MRYLILIQQDDLELFQHYKDIYTILQCKKTMMLLLLMSLLVLQDRLIKIFLCFLIFLLLSVTQISLANKG